MPIITTLQEIEKEFEEKYPQLLRKRLYEELDLGGNITIECSSDVKSFLKQSFIKYLQSEVEFVVTLPSCRRTMQMKEHLQAQIKELEV